MTVSAAGCLNSERLEARRIRGTLEENRPNRTVLFKLWKESGSRTSNRDQFVSIGIAKVSEICSIRAHARRVLD
jgi:hypothetical protein